ncbi:MAG TPA: TIR domain-containing protein [Streptosporangiaceae bacterium]|jgi:WD40 repeat protein
MHHVFVSYSRSDGEWVGGLVKRLEHQRVKVWIDQEDIPVTVPWLTEVRDAIEEAALFVRCDSSPFRVSVSCSAEVGFATQVAKPQLVIEVGSGLDDCAASIIRTRREISPARAQRTELRVLSRDWDRAGRPRNLLVGRRYRRRLARALNLTSDPTETERGFLRACTTRTRVRALVTTVVVSLIAASFTTISVLHGVQNTVNNDNSSLATAYNQEQAGLNLVDQDPYSGLQAAAADGGNESAANADVITQALAEPTPDNAFNVPGARRFAAVPVGAQVLVTGAAGRQWRHSSASADAGQPATELPRSATAASTVATASTAGGVTARGNPHSGLVQIFRHGLLWRTIDFDAVTGALAFSPDGRFLAATVGEQVEVADVAAAQVRTHLRGATGSLLDVAWNSDGTNIWALDDGRVFCWATGNAVTLVDDPSANFNSVLAAANPGDAWVVGQHALTEISVATGTTLRTLTLPDTLGSAGVAPDGSLALVSGDRYLWVVPLSGTAPPHRVTLPGCDLGRPTFASDTTAYLPCIGGSLLRLSIPSATVTTSIPVSSNGVFGAAAVPGTDTVYVGDETGFLYVVQGDSATPVLASECDAEIEHIAVSPGERAVLPVGSGSGEGTCTTVGLRTAAGIPASTGSWTWNHLVEPQEQSIFASAVAFSAHGGSFAIGYSNGTITMHPTGNLTPVLVDNTADGMIRDMLTLPDNNLIFVTDTGMVQRLPFCDSCISNVVLAKVAASRLQLAKRLGLVVFKRVSDKKLPFGPAK